MWRQAVFSTFNFREPLEPQQPWEEDIVPILQMKLRLKEVKLVPKDTQTK